jgi:hypothetical protein
VRPWLAVLVGAVLVAAASAIQRGIASSLRADGSAEEASYRRALQRLSVVFAVIAFLLVV